MTAVGGAPAGDHSIDDSELRVGALQHGLVAVRIVHPLGSEPVAMLQVGQDHGADVGRAAPGVGVDPTVTPSAEPPTVGTEPVVAPGALAAASSDRAVGEPIVVISPVSTVKIGRASCRESMQDHE